jgi:hypothetical protein
MESPTLIDVWTFDSSRRGEVLEAITRLMRDHVRVQPGFLSGRIYESADGTAAVVEVRMRTVEDRQHLLEVPSVRSALRELRGIASTHANLYRLLESIDGES